MTARIRVIKLFDDIELPELNYKNHLNLNVKFNGSGVTVYNKYNMTLKYAHDSENFVLEANDIGEFTVGYNLELDYDIVYRVVHSKDILNHIMPLSVHDTDNGLLVKIHNASDKPINITDGMLIGTLEFYPRIGISLITDF